MGTRYAANPTTLSRGDGAYPTVGTYTAIAQVRTVGGPGGSRDKIDVSAHGDKFRQFVSALADGGDVTLDLIFDPADATHLDLWEDWKDGKVHPYKIDWPSGGDPLTFGALVTGYSPNAPHDGELSAQVTLSVTGEPLLAGGS